MSIYTQNANYTSDGKATIGKPSGDGENFRIEVEPRNSAGTELFTLANPGAVDQVGAVTIAGTAGSAVGDNIIAQTDVSKYRSIAIQITGTFVATILARFSNDGTTWNTIPVSSVTATTTNPATTMTAVGLYNVPVVAKYFQLYVSAYTSGSPCAVVTYFQNAIQTVNCAPIVTTPVYAIGQSTTSGITSSKVISAATTNATVIRAAAGRLYELSAANTGTTTIYVKLYNATSITVGTTVPTVAVFAIPAGSTLTLIPMNFLGKYFSVGICMAITGGYADTDTTAVTAGAVIVNYSYC